MDPCLPVPCEAGYSVELEGHPPVEDDDEDELLLEFEENTPIRFDEILLRELQDGGIAHSDGSRRSLEM